MRDLIVSTVLKTQMYLADLIPNPDPVLPDGVSDKLSDIIAAGKGIGIVVGVICMIGAGIAIAASFMSHDGARRVTGLIWVLLGVGIIVTSGSLVAWFVL